MWFIPQYVFINNVSFRSFLQPWFSFSIISHKLFTSISKEIYCGHINHRKLFNVVSWSTIRQWKKVALLAVMLICRLALMNTFIFLFPKDVDKINIIFNTNDKFITNTGMYVKFLFRKCLFIYSILVLVWMLEQLIAFTCRLYMNGVVTTMK